MKITCISTVPTLSLAEAVNELNCDSETGIDFRTYYPNEIDEEDIDV
jgi:hypothetical protein